MEYAEHEEDSDNHKAASEHDDLISTHSSHTSFDESIVDYNGDEEWRREMCKSEGRMTIIGEYSSRTKFYRTIVIVSRMLLCSHALQY